MEVVSPAPRELWAAAVAADPMSLADHTPAWTDAVCESRWRDASRAYLLPGARGFRHPGRVHLNPSYYGFRAIRALAGVMPNSLESKSTGDRNPPRLPYV